MAETLTVKLEEVTPANMSGPPQPPRANANIPGVPSQAAPGTATFTPAGVVIKPFEDYLALVAKSILDEQQKAHDALMVDLARVQLDPTFAADKVQKKQQDDEADAARAHAEKRKSGQWSDADYLAEVEQALQAQRQKEADAQRIEAARRQVDPAYDQAKLAEEAAQAQDEAERAKKEAARQDAERRQAGGWSDADYLAEVERALQAQRQKEEDQRRLEAARRQADPVYDAQKQDEEAERAKKDAEQAKKEAERAHAQRLESGQWTDTDFMAEAEKATRAAAIQKENEKRLDEARRQVDPDYARKREDADKNKLATERGQKMGLAANALTAAGMPAAGAIVGGFAAGPISGMISTVAVAMDLLEKGVRQSFQQAAAVASFDPDKVARSVAEMQRSIPIVGGVLGSLTDGILDLSDAVFATANKLSQYSPILAQKMAEIEIRQIQRDIDRAQRFGPQLAEQVERRVQFQEKIQEAMDKLMPTVMRVLEMGLEMMPAIENYIKTNLAQMLATMENGLGLAEGVGGHLMSVGRILGEMNTNTRLLRERSEEANSEFMVADLFASRGPNVGLPGLPAAPGAPGF